MSRLRIFALAGAAAALLATGARAADYPDRPPLFEKPAVVQEFASGWYIRGDIGYRLNEVDGSANLLGYTTSNASIDDTAVFGLGGGYKAGWFRADVTLDYSGRATWKADVLPAFAAGQPGISTRFETITTLANMYVDLGTWWGFTPYVGAGAGAAYMRSRQLYDAAVPGEAAHRNDKWNFAWALIGGVSYRIGANLLVDASYRWLDLGDVVSSVNSIGNQLTLKDITAHELRIGLRYNLD